MKSTYNITFGILSAIGIICVVMGHVGCTMLSFDNFFPYASFHIPLFFFISGYFYTHKKEKSVWRNVKQKIQKLLIPVYWISIFYYFITEILIVSFGFKLTAEPFSLQNILIDPWIHTQPSGFIPSAWFAISLLITEILHVFFQKGISFIPIKQKDYITLLLYIMLGNIIIIRGTNGLSDFIINIQKAILGLTFYQIGYMYKYYFESWDIKIPDNIYFSVLLLIREILHYIYGWCSIAWYDLSDLNECFFLIILSAITGIMFWLRIARIFSPLVKENAYIIYLGKHTFSIMINHLFVIFLIQGFIGIIHLKFGLFPTFDISMYKTHVYYVFNKNISIPLFLTMGSISVILLFEKIKDKLKTTKKYSLFMRL